MQLARIFLLFSFLIPLSVESRVKAPKIELSTSVVARLDHVMGKADDLRQALVDQKEPLVITKARELGLVLSDAIKTQDPDAQNKKHLDLILKDARSAVEQALTTTGEERKSTFQQVFRQLVLVGQTYKITENVKFYFCRRDRSVWVQKTGKPRNPINPSDKDCGVQVQ